MEYRLRPDAASFRVEAARWFKLGDHSAVTKIYGAGTASLCGCGYRSDEHGFLGADAVCPGDWIVQNARGEVRRVRPDDFAELYEHAAGTERWALEKAEAALNPLSPFVRKRMGKSAARYLDRLREEIREALQGEPAAGDDPDLALEIISFLDPDAVEDFKAWRALQARYSGATEQQALINPISRDRSGKGYDNPSSNEADCREAGVPLQTDRDRIR